MAIILPTIDGGWPCILADPPWRFASNSEAKPGRNAVRHYPCMTLTGIAELPVRAVAADDCTLFLWVTGPILAIGGHLPILKAWGFRPSSVAFVWSKGRAGTGYTTRKSVAFVILGKRGRSLRKDKGVLDFIDEPARHHSRKPEEAYRRIERYCDGPRLELFPGPPQLGWTQWGDPLKDVAQRATRGSAHALAGDRVPS